MNKTDIVEIMSNKTTKLAAIFVLVGAMMMVFMVPMVSENADARTNVHAKSTAGPFSNIKVQLFAGKFVFGPIHYPPDQVRWETWGGNFPVGGGSEFGRFSANVGGPNNIVVIDFANPARGPNTCKVLEVHGGIDAKCTISGGNWAIADFTITPRVQQADNKHCDIIDKIGGIEQTNVIREKLHC